jgi:15-cis-phytoene synthase
MDPDGRLALAYAPAAARPALEALWRLDVTLGAVLATGREPMVTRIRLAWWREALERLDHAPPPPEPVLEGVARHLLPAGIAGAELAAMEAGWEAIADPGRLPREALDSYAEARGATLFRLCARLLGGADFDLAAAGELWALADLARRSADPADRAAALDSARGRHGPKSWPKRLRPLGMLAVLADRDLKRASPESQGAPGRMLRMLRHRLTGR